MNKNPLLQGENRLKQLSTLIRNLKIGNRLIRRDLAKDAHFLDKVDSSLDEIDYVKKFMVDSELNFQKAKGYETKIEKMEIRISKKLAQLEELE